MSEDKGKDLGKKILNVILLGGKIKVKRGNLYKGGSRLQPVKPRKEGLF